MGAERLHGHQHLAGAGRQVGMLLDAQAVMAAGAMDDDLLHVYASWLKGSELASPGLTPVKIESDAIFPFFTPIRLFTTCD
jgi:hypothetical protein